VLTGALRSSTGLPPRGSRFVWPVCGYLQTHGRTAPRPRDPRQGR
jgi:hypothetical protein